VLDEPINSPVEEMISNVVDIYFQTLEANPRMPFFLVQELLLNPDRRDMIRQHFILNPLRQEAYAKYSSLVKRLQSEGRIRPIEPFDLLINVVSLVASTFLSLPLYADLLDKTPAEQQSYLNGRKEEVKRMLISRLLPL
jgi:AcrR family transcriptional regulator